jgi:hypothetical protein
MKIALACDSLLLTKTLEIFLKKHIATYKRCDFVISDKKIEIDKPLFVISKKSEDLKSPFSQASLTLELDKFYDNLYSKEDSDDSDKSEIKEKINFLINKFKDDLMDIIDEKK